MLRPLRRPVEAPAGSGHNEAVGPWFYSGTAKTKEMEEEVEVQKSEKEREGERGSLLA